MTRATLEPETPIHTSWRTFGPDGFNLDQTRLYGEFSMESGFAPEALRPRSQDLTLTERQLAPPIPITARIISSIEWAKEPRLYHQTTVAHCALEI
ncbi:hypothetical protein AVEN_183654-1 [Araneus ventricosus]|uniref:Uncharacterized protein n=1 Tax=Araneus ventricosus TaxID=182803 RepID=A0A4Y2I163_ARAVE|nr:hypothetical protein AVEN_183654-1 [Araneus ventricosus]